MFEEFEIDISLYYLQQVLFSLESYRYDDDITKLLKELRVLTDKKMLINSKYPDKDIKDIKYITKYFYENN